MAWHPMKPETVARRAREHREERRRYLADAIPRRLAMAEKYPEDRDYWLESAANLRVELAELEAAP